MAGNLVTINMTKVFFSLLSVLFERAKLHKMLIEKYRFRISFNQFYSETQ